MPSAPTLLDDARAMIERGWSQGADARDGAGHAVKPWCPDARMWSLLGALVAALEAATDRNEGLEVGELAVACIALAAVIDHDSLESWNDDPTRTRADVLAALDRALTKTARAATQPNAWN